MAPGGFVLALAAARKSVARAFCFGGGGAARGHVARRGSSGGGKRLFGGGRFAAEKPGSDGGDAGRLAATPPESPFPPGNDDDLVSFFLLRHGQTNFNAIGRIQVRASLNVLCVRANVKTCVSSHLPLYRERVTSSERSARAAESDWRRRASKFLFDYLSF